MLYWCIDFGKFFNLICRVAKLFECPSYDGSDSCAFCSKHYCVDLHFCKHRYWYSMKSVQEFITGEINTNDARFR